MEAIEEFFAKIFGKKEPVDNRILIGVSLVLFGVLFFAKELNILRSNSIFLSTRMCALYLTLIFLAGRQFKFAMLFGGITIFTWLPNMWELLWDYHNFIIPSLFIIFGAILIFVKNKKNTEDKDEFLSTEDEPTNEETQRVFEEGLKRDSDHSRYQPQAEDESETTK